MALTGLDNGTLQLILFGGKGGVGKTTCAASAGMYLAQHGKTLIISTDPAHSLSDSLDQALNDHIQEIPGYPHLYALEINAEKALASFKEDHEEEIKKILDTATHLDQEDIESLFSLPIPGIDEVMGLKRIIDLIEEAAFEKYIVDTAPTGHALRLLSSPHLLDDWIKVMAKMRWKYRYMVTRFAGEYKPDEGDDLLLSMKKTVKRIEGLLQNAQRSQFIAVTIPEAMAIAETERLIGNLAHYGMTIKHLVVNNVFDSEDCRFCRARKQAQKPYIEYIEKELGDLKTTLIPLQPEEVKGLNALEKFKDLLF